MNPGIARGLEPKTRAFVTAVEAQGGPPIDQLSYEASRALLEAAWRTSAPLPAPLLPVTEASCDTASYAAFAEGPWLTKAMMQWFFNAYCAPHSRGERRAR
jgi:hypothetical protein